MEHRTFRCYAWKTGDDWEAMCVDLDIAVQGRTFAEVRASLRTCVIEYVATALQKTDEECALLLSRKAPFMVRMMLAMRAAGTGLLKPFRESDGNASSFPVHADMTPA